MSLPLGFDVSLAEWSDILLASERVGNVAMWIRVAPPPLYLYGFDPVGLYCLSFANQNASKP
jgi:hypothetical protein